MTDANLTRRGPMSGGLSRWQDDQEPFLSEEVSNDADDKADPAWDVTYAQAQESLYEDYEEADYRPGADDRPANERSAIGSNTSSLMMVALTVLAVAALGGGGALAWKAGFLGGSSASDSDGSPPVIHASSEPSKIVPPPTATNDPAAPRDFATGSSEKIVSRVEQPVPVTLASPAATPPAPTQPSLPPSADAKPPVTGMPAGDSAGAQQVRKVKTVKVLADGTVVTGEAPAPASDVASSLTAPPSGAPPAPLAPSVPAPSGLGASPPALAPTVGQSLPQPRPKDETRPVAAPAKPVVTAARTPPPLSPLPQPEDTEGLPPADIDMPHVAAGSYMVQIASTRSEAEATSTLRSLQRRYGSIIGSMKPVIRKAELGTRGTFYRVRLGPMISGVEAKALCDRLIAAGKEDCVAVRN